MADMGASSGKGADPSRSREGDMRTRIREELAELERERQLIEAELARLDDPELRKARNSVRLTWLALLRAKQRVAIANEDVTALRKDPVVTDSGLGSYLNDDWLEADGWTWENTEDGRALVPPEGLADQHDIPVPVAQSPAKDTAF